MKSPLLRLRGNADNPGIRAGQADGQMVLDGQVPEEFGIQAQAVEALPAEEVADL